MNWYCFVLADAALGIIDHLRRRFAGFDQRTHLLQACNKRFNLFLLLCGSGFLLCDNRLQFLHRAVFQRVDFQKIALVSQDHSQQPKIAVASVRQLY